VASETAARDAAAGTQTPVSLDAYRRNVGGSITIAVTGTDNPVPSQITDARSTPTEPTPAVPTEPREEEQDPDTRADG
jgi:septal ring-binding cell division protein DamX